MNVLANGRCRSWVTARRAKPPPYRWLGTDCPRNQPPRAGSSTIVARQGLQYGFHGLDEIVILAEWDFLEVLVCFFHPCQFGWGGLRMKVIASCVLGRLTHAASPSIALCKAVLDILRSNLCERLSAAWRAW